MENTQFTSLSEQELITVNGGGLLDNIPVVGGLLGTLTNLVSGLPVVGPLLGGLLTTVQGLLTSVLGGINLPV